MITDGLSPVTVLLFLGAVAAGVVLVALYVVARVTKRESLAKVSMRLLLGGAGTLLAASYPASRTRPTLRLKCR